MAETISVLNNNVGLSTMEFVTIHLRLWFKKSNKYRSFSLLTLLTFFISASLLSSLLSMVSLFLSMLRLWVWCAWLDWCYRRKQRRRLMERKSEHLLSKCKAISIHSRIIVWVNASHLTKVSMKQSPVLHCWFFILYQLWYIHPISVKF